MAWLFVSGELELHALINDLQQWEKRRNVLDAFDGPLHRLATVTSLKVQASVLATESKRQNASRGRRSLRRAIASAVATKSHHLGDASMSTIYVDGNKMPSGEEGLAALYEGVSDWFHPVYGHRPIVHQDPHPYFGIAIMGVERDAEQAGDKSIDKIADDLEG